MRSATVVELEDGREVRLQGLSLPAYPVRPRGFEKRLQQFVADRVVGRSFWIHPDPGNEPGQRAELTAVLRAAAGDKSINAAALEAGVALLSCRSASVGEMPALLAAARRAQSAGRGWFAREPKPLQKVGYLNGAVVGLHHQDNRDYRRQIDELVEAGFKHVGFLLSAFIHDAEANEIKRTHRRTVRDARLIETLRYAKGKGVSVFLLPIVLLEEPGEDDWRGTLRPKNEREFWLNYDRFLCHYLDLAENSGVDLFSIGSELGSLEDRTDAWTRLIQHARGRYRGLLTYSANWDHVHVPRFLGKLDVVGLTAYFSLTQKKDPTQEELDSAWRAQGRELARAVGMLGKPVVFTELGYASQNGINTDPWNYYIAQDDIDLAEQAMCFRAFLSAADEMKFLSGAYFYDFYDLGGDSDHSYSPRGKPAFAEWKRWARWRE